MGDDKSGTKGFIISFDDDKDVNTKKKISKTEIVADAKTPDPVMIMLDMNEDTDSSNVNGNTEDDSNNFDSTPGIQDFQK